MSADFPKGSSCEIVVPHEEMGVAKEAVLIEPVAALQFPVDERVKAPPV